MTHGMKFLSLIFGFSMISSLALGVDYELKPSELKKLQIVGFEGDVELIAQPNAQSLKVKITPVKVPTDKDRVWSWAPSLKRIADTAEIRIEGPVSKKDWEAVILKNEWPKYNVQITGTPMALELFWRKGSLKSSNWAKPLSVHYLDGDLKLGQGSDDLKVSLQKGKLQVKTHKGPVSVSGLELDSKLEDITGDLSVRSLKGATDLVKIKGVAQLEVDQGKSNVTGVTGSLNFSNGRGEMKISGVQGGIDGSTANGPVEIRYEEGGEVQMESQSAEVVVRVPKAAAPWAEVNSEDGDIFVPGYFSVRQKSAGKTAKGRIRGGAREGSIRVSSKTGDIYLR